MNSIRPRISVVLCTFNGADFVAQQIESILEQSVLPDELIIADDCSHDGTVDIVRGYEVRHPHLIRLVSNRENLGYVRNFVRAIMAADGDVIFLADQDDVWFTEKIESMVQPFIVDSKVGLVYCNAVVTGAGLEPTDNTLFGRRRHLRLGELRSATDLIRGVGINGCTMAFRADLKALIDPVGPGWGHDHWIAFVSSAVAPVVAVAKPLMYYRRHTGSAGNDPFLAGDPRHAWRAGLNASVVDSYEADLCRWEVMSRRLSEMVANHPGIWVDETLLAGFDRECKKRVDLARERSRLRSLNRWSRLPGLFRLALSGDYQRYLRGGRSLAKDLFVR